MSYFDSELSFFDAGIYINWLKGFCKKKKHQILNNSSYNIVKFANNTVWKNFELTKEPNNKNFNICI